MNIIIISFFLTIWLAWLGYTFRKDLKKISILTIGFISQIVGAFLVFQDGIKADEQGLEGNLFGNKIALLLIGVGIVIVITMTVLFFLKKKN
jgi:hypothetical protein